MEANEVHAEVQPKPTGVHTSDDVYVSHACVELHIYSLSLEACRTSGFKITQVKLLLNNDCMFM